MAVKINPTSVKVSVKVLGISVNALLDEVTWVVKYRRSALPTIRLWRHINMQQTRSGMILE